MTQGPCDRCEELLQDYLDRTLTDAEVASVQQGLVTRLSRDVSATVRS